MNFNLILEFIYIYLVPVLFLISLVLLILGVTRLFKSRTKASGKSMIIKAVILFVLIVVSWGYVSLFTRACGMAYTVGINTETGECVMFPTTCMPKGFEENFNYECPGGTPPLSY